MEKKKAILKIESYSAKDGMLLLSVHDNGVKTMIKNLTDLCKEKYSSYIKVDMSPPYKQRTLDQNALWWQLCTDYAFYLGSNKDEVAEGVKYRAMEEGLWESVEVPFSKTGARVPKSTADADTKEMSILIDVLYRVAAEDGYSFDDA